MQFHSCGEEDIPIGLFFGLSPQSSQLGAQDIALGGEEWGALEAGSITEPSLASSEQLVAVGVSVGKMLSFTL